MTITSQSATFLLIDPVAASTEDFMNEVRAECGFLVGPVDGAIKFLTGTSPLERWLVEPFAGGWDVVDKASQAWSSVGEAIAITSSNIAGVPGQLMGRWEGDTAGTFAASNTKIAQTLALFPTGCNALSEACATLAEIAKSGVKTIASIISTIVDIVTTIVALAAGILSAPAAAGPAAYLVANFPLWFIKVMKIVAIIMEAISLITTIIGGMATLVQSFAELKNNQASAFASVTASSKKATDAFAV